MPVHYKIDAERGLIRTICVEPMIHDDVIAHFRELEADPRLPESLDVLLDLSGVQSLPEFRQVRSVAGAVERLRNKVKWEKLAVVAPADAVFGIGRMFETMTEPSFQATHVFRTHAEAERWLGICPSGQPGPPG